MFKEISNGVIASTEGYIVNNHGHWEVIYIEGDHIAKFHAEPGTNGYIYWLDVAVKWEPPFADEIISHEKQEQIKDRIVAAITFRGLGGEFDR